MLSNAVVVFSFVAAAAAAAEPALVAAKPTPYMMGMPSEMDPLGLRKRQAGYQPTETACNPGNTCVESCGQGSVLCDDSNNPSPDFAFYCYNPSLGETCCSDRTGST
jgi:hypothetical protein